MTPPSPPSLLPSFPLPLLVKIIDKGKRAILYEPFKFIDEDVSITVPAGFVTDFNSSPRPLWAWFSPLDYPEAGVIHDYLYRKAGWWDRKKADQIHLRIMKLLEAPFYKSYPAYAALRLFGWVYWNSLP